jgi:hypothetical protein
VVVFALGEGGKRKEEKVAVKEDEGGPEWVTEISNEVGSEAWCWINC